LNKNINNPNPNRNFFVGLAKRKKTDKMVSTSRWISLSFTAW